MGPVPDAGRLRVVRRCDRRDDRGAHRMPDPAEYAPVHCRPRAPQEEPRVRAIRRGERGPAVVEIRVDPGRRWICSPSRPGDADDFDDATETRGTRLPAEPRPLRVDGDRRRRRPGGRSTRARWRLGARTLYHARARRRCVGDDVRALQERLLEMGYDVGRADGIYGARTARAVAQFQREVGLDPDGVCGPQTMHALRRLGRKVVGGRPQLAARDRARSASSGPSLVGKRIVIDPGHGGRRPGRRRARRPAALDRGRPGVRPRRPAGGPARRGRACGCT